MEWLRQHRSFAIASIRKIMLDIYCKLCIVEEDNTQTYFVYISPPISGGREYWQLENTTWFGNGVDLFRLLGSGASFVSHL